MRQLVDQRPGRPAGDDGVEVHLLELLVAIGELATRNALEITDLRSGVRAVVRLDVADHEVGAALMATPALVQHGVRLADAWSRPQVHAQLTAGHQALRLLVEIEIEEQDVHDLLAEEAPLAVCGVLRDQLEDLVDR